MTNEEMLDTIYEKSLFGEKAAEVMRVPLLKNGTPDINAIAEIFGITQKNTIRPRGDYLIEDKTMYINPLKIINRKNNKVGQLTYDTWCPENGGGTREYEGTMGDDISIEFDVYTLKPEDETEDTEQEAEVVEDQPERNNQDNQNDHRETSGTSPNLQQINNPFTFIQNGDNNTQIGYIANQTIVKK